jgi:hypothetical protein
MDFGVFFGFRNKGIALEQMLYLIREFTINLIADYFNFIQK